MSHRQDLDWQEDALCVEVDPDLFHSDDRSGENAGHVALAKMICRRCDVLDECLSWALATEDRFAVLGGTTAGERRKMRASARKQVAA